MRKDPNALAGIYRITRLSDGKVYIGQARKCSQRWTMHRHSLKNGKHRNKPLQEAWDAASPMDFSWEIVCQPIGGNNPETMTYLEIEVLRAYPDNFNLMVPVQAYLGASESTRAKLSAKRLEQWGDPAYRARLSETHTRNMADPQHRAKWKEGMAAFHASDESKQIRREGGKKASKAWEERPEMRKAERERRKNLWKDPVYRARMTAARKAAWADPEKCSRRVASLKKAWADTPPDKRAARVQTAAEAVRSDDVREVLRRKTQQRWDEGRGPRPRKAKP